MSPFRIIAPQPVITHSADGATSFNEIFPRSVGENTPCAHLVWNGIPVRLSYSFDAYQNALDLAELVHKIRIDSKGTAEMFLMTDILFLDWKISWNDELCIQSEFLSRTNAFDRYAALLNQHPEMKLSKNEFIQEICKWLKQLNNIVEEVAVEGFSKEREMLSGAMKQINA